MKSVHKELLSLYQKQLWFKLPIETSTQEGFFVSYFGLVVVGWELSPLPSTRVSCN